jgi:hypothetical protein
MGHKNKQQPPSLTITSAMEAQLATLNTTLGQICGKLDTMERAIHELRVENSAVREELAAARITIIQKDEAIRLLTENVNRIDQASRVNTLRIFGLPITNTTPTAAIPNIIFKEIIAPVIAHAVEAGDFPATPPPPFCLTLSSTQPSLSLPRIAVPAQFWSS